MNYVWKQACYRCYGSLGSIPQTHIQCIMLLHLVTGPLLWQMEFQQMQNPCWHGQALKCTSARTLHLCCLPVLELSHPSQPTDLRARNTCWWLQKHRGVVSACYRAKLDWGGEQYLQDMSSSLSPRVVTTSPHMAWGQQWPQKFPLLLMDRGSDTRFPEGNLLPSTTPFSLQ